MPLICSPIVNAERLLVSVTDDERTETLKYRGYTTEQWTRIDWTAQMTAPTEEEIEQASQLIEAFTGGWRFQVDDHTDYVHVTLECPQGHPWRGCDYTPAEALVNALKDGGGDRNCPKCNMLRIYR